MAIQIKDCVNSSRVQHFSAEENSLPANQTQELNEGHPFRPYKVFNGATVPNSLWSNKDLSIEAKAVYARLLSYCGAKDSCNPRLETLADAVGLSEDRTERALKQLKERNFIKRTRSGPGRAAVTQLLWNSLLSPSLKLGLDPAPVRNQGVSLIPQNQGVDSAPVRCLDPAPVRNLYKEEEVQFEEVHEVSTTTKAPFPISNEKHPNGWWSEEQLSEARKLLESHTTNRQLGTPDSVITGRILSNLDDWSDFELYLRWRRQSPGPVAKSWAFYENDAKQYWPQRRKDCLSDLDAAKRKEQDKQAQMEQNDLERKDLKERNANEERAKTRAKYLVSNPETRDMSEHEFNNWFEGETQRMFDELDAKMRSTQPKRKKPKIKDSSGSSG